MQRCNCVLQCHDMLHVMTVGHIAILNSADNLNVSLTLQISASRLIPFPGRVCLAAGSTCSGSVGRFNSVQTELI